jgi:G:T/U-mismatch repair DNA glycosylase
MSWNTKFTFEEHHFSTFIPENANTLIIGTFPTHKHNYKNTFCFYYGSKDNNFWNVIEQTFKHKFKFNQGEAAVEERKEFFIRNKIGITDMIANCYRKGRSSSDTSLYPLELMDIVGLLNQFASIEKLVLTSRSGMVSTLGLFKVHLLQKNIEAPKLTQKGDKIIEGSFQHNNRNIKVLVPYSTSPKLINGGITTLEELVKMYTYCLK